MDIWLLACCAMNDKLELNLLRVAGEYWAHVFRYSWKSGMRPGGASCEGDGSGGEDEDEPLIFSLMLMSLYSSATGASLLFLGG